MLKYIHEYQVYVPVELSKEEHELPRQEKEELIVERGEEELKKGNGEIKLNFLDVREDD